MSTKDLIERLNRTQTTTRRTAGEETAKTGQGVSTRVGARVIRRRKKVEAPAPAAPPTLPTQAAATKDAAPKAEESPAAAEADAAAEPVAEAAAEATETAPQKEQAPEDAKGNEKTAAKAEPADAAAEADATPTAEAAEPAEAASSEATVAASADAGATTNTADEAAVDAPAEGTAEADSSAPEAAESLAKGLPRADGSPGKTLPRLGAEPKPEAKRFTGLGSAVVKPPPGYDPSNPEAARKANEAAREAERQKKWKDQTTGTGAPGTRPARTGEDDEQKRSAGRPRRRESRRTRVEMYMDDIPAAHRRRRRTRKMSGPKKTSPQAKAIKRRVEVDGSITVAALAHGMSVKTGLLIKKLIGMGQMATANDELDLETAQLVAEEFEFEIVNTTFSEDDHMIQVEESDGDEGQVTRPPVVTIMGHVDHGKTTLLDTIRRANVAAGEAGGITQHTAAYQVEHEGQTITFIDTPGHAAFTEMRSRGAQVTDIVVLVVAADDGIMPQTVEAINHSKAAGVQILVAVNKCDKPGVDPNQVRQALMEHELVPEEYGGDTIMCNVSALKGDGLDDLLANIALLAEVAEYSANPERHADGTVLEARVEKGRGPVATLLVQNGTLNQGDTVVLGTVWGRVRAITDYTGTRIKSAGPSSPIEIIGIQDVPSAGDNFVVVEGDKAARALVDHRIETERRKAQSGPRSVSLEELLAQASEGEKVQLNLVVKADVNGTLEAIKASFDQIDVEGATVKFLHAAVGGVSESDVTLAQTYGAVIIGFNVRPDSKARHLADEYAIQIRTYSVIYEAIEDVEAAMKGLLEPEIKEIVKGIAEIRETFNVPKVGTVAGVRVQEGSIARSHQVRLLRDGVILWTGKLASLRRFKDDVREVEKGYECGMNLEGFNDIKVGDLLETFVQEEAR
ncbi:MAG: translation initiation factor IF-2 [Myxococcota bacterium]|nr:translation initiation factor IF-2 [Myxococcota bacterium]